EPGCLGFSSNRLDPAKIGEAAQRKGPFYAFPGNRLVKRGKTHFYSFADPFGKDQPYAYFSNFGERNGYHRYGTSDCAGLGVAPYYAELKPPRYYKERSYQIISAGADGVFGPGGRWEPKAPIPAAGRDDRANFSGGEPLGTAVAIMSDPSGTSTGKDK